MYLFLLLNLCQNYSISLSEKNLEFDCQCPTGFNNFFSFFDRCFSQKWLNNQMKTKPIRWYDFILLYLWFFWIFKNIFPFHAKITLKDMIFMKLTFVFSLKSNCNSIENLCISAAQTYPFTGYPCLMDFPSKTRIKSMAPMDCMCLVCTMVLVAWIHSGVSNSKRKGITINSGGKLVQVRTI